MDRAHWKELTDKDLFEKVVASAHEALSNKFWGNGAVPDGTTAESLALDAMEDVMLGAAYWDPLENPSPFPVLAGIVRSKVANLVRSYRNRKARYLVGGEEPGEADPAIVKLLDEASASSLLDRVEHAIGNDPDLTAYFSAACRFEKRSEIAVELRVSVSEVTNLQKRLRRVVAPFWNQQETWLDPAGVANK